MTSDGEQTGAGAGDGGEGSDGGQVSEVQQMPAEDADTPISDSQAVAGQPDSDSGEVQEGPAGPNAKVDREREEEDLDRDTP